MPEEKDSVWKEAIESYFPDFMNFFFPKIAKEIDFNKGYQFLDKELEKITSNSELGKRLADILVKTYLKDGTEKWLLIHVEIQGYYEKDFAKRMFIYNYRIFDRYNNDVISLAIITDPSANYISNRYEVKYCDFELIFRFPTVKITDYKNKWEELSNSKNPFAIIVMTHLKEIETKKDDDQRLFWKITLVKQLYDKGYSKNDILLLYKFIDWLVTLPKELNNKFHKEIVKYEEVKKMPYITTAERIGIEKGMLEGIQQGIQKGMQQGIQKGMQQGLKQGLLEAIELGLKLKFKTKGLKLFSKISKIDDVDKLRTIKDAIEIAEDLSEIEELIK